MLVSSCSEKSDSKSTAETESETKADPAPTKAAGAVVIDLKTVSPAAAAQARKHNGAALAKQKAGDFAGAIKMYEQAVAADPGHVFAHYNMASALAKSGDGAGAVKILEALAKVPDCIVCQGRLVRAKADSDFDGMRQDPAFNKLTDGAKVASPSPKQASAELLAARDKGAVPAALVHPRNPVSFRSSGKRKRVAGAAAVHKMLSAEGLAGGEASSCTKSCCAVSPTEATLNSAPSRITELCFKKDSGGVVTLSSVSIHDSTPAKTGTGGIRVVADNPDPDLGEWSIGAEGLPAVSADGKQVALAITDEDGCRGFPNLRVVVRDVGSDKDVKSWTVLDVDKYAAAEESGGSLDKIQDAAVARGKEIEKFFAKGKWTSLKRYESTREDSLDEQQTIKAADLTATYRSPKLAAKRKGKEVFSVSNKSWVDTTAVSDMDGPMVDVLYTLFYDAKAGAAVAEIAYLHGPHCASQVSSYASFATK